MLPDTPDVAEVLFGDKGVGWAQRPGKDRGRHELHSRDGDQAIRREDKEKGCEYLDAPVFWRRSRREGRHAHDHGRGNEETFLESNRCSS